MAKDGCALAATVVVLADAMKMAFRETANCRRFLSRLHACQNAWCK